MQSMSFVVKCIQDVVFVDGAHCYEHRLCIERGM
jgi:hypothetical protein